MTLEMTVNYDHILPLEAYHPTKNAQSWGKISAIKYIFNKITF